MCSDDFEVRGRWFAAAVCMITFMLSYTDRFVLNLLVVPIQQELHLSDTQIGLLIGTVFAVVYGLVGLPLGRLADSANRRNIIAAALLVWTAGTILCAFAGTFKELFLAR